MLIALFILIVVTMVAVIASIVDSKRPSATSPKQEEVAEDKSCDFSGTLSDRNVAALNYIRMRESLRKNTNDFKDLPDGAMKQFDYVASHLATIGTKAKPEEVIRCNEDGLPAGWGFDKSSKKQEN